MPAVPVETVEDCQQEETLQAGPSPSELLLLVLLSGSIFVAVIRWFEPYANKVETFGDSLAYMTVADAIRHWDFSGLAVKQFWGLPYVMAAVSGLTGISSRNSLLLVSFSASLLSVLLARKLWGGRVAALFALLSFDWMQRSFLGGAEPLFVALLLGCFLALRRQRWNLAVFLSALATTVRPLAIVALIGIGCVLLWKLDYKKFAMATAIGIAVGAAYVTSLSFAVGDPLATVHSYTLLSEKSVLFGIPFRAIAVGTLTIPAPWTNLVLTVSWIGFILIGTIVLLTTGRFQYVKLFPVEAFFAAGYLLLICCYNLPYWARGTFPRFAIPLIPFAIVGLAPWIPKSRWLTGTLVLVSPILAAGSALGILNVMHRLGVS